MTDFPAGLQDQLISGLREADRDRYLCLLLMPEDKRGLVSALYAFNAELAQIRERITDPAAGELRLGWWEDVVDGIYLGQTVDAPVPQGLARAIEAGDLPRHTFKAMLEARRFDLFDDAMPDLNSLEGYLGETSSALLQMSALVMAGDYGLECAEVSGYAGVAMGLTGVLRSLPLHRVRGQCYLPADMLAKHDLTPAHVLSDRGGAGLEIMLLQLCQHVQKRLDEARAEQHRIPETALTAYLPVSLVPGYLRKLQSARGAMTSKVISSPQWVRQLRLFRALRAETF
jgi:phytoene synthase